MEKFTGISDNEELKLCYKIENLQNTDFIEHDNINEDEKTLNLGSDMLLNPQITLLDLGDMSGFEEYNKIERR